MSPWDWRVLREPGRELKKTTCGPGGTPSAQRCVRGQRAWDIVREFEGAGPAQEKRVSPRATAPTF